VLEKVVYNSKNQKMSTANIKRVKTTDIELKDKLVIGLEKVYERLIEFKKQKNNELVVIKDNKIVKIKPE
jgi:RecA-family ATPase